MIFYLLSSSFLLHLIVCAYSLSVECNPMECFQAFDTLFQPSNMETSCEKITNLQECIKVCSRNETDHYFHQGLAEVREELCRNNRNHNRLENKCENKHKYGFAACIYEKFNYEAEDPSISQNVLLCKQAQDGDNCYATSLPMCSDRAGYLAFTLLVKLFDPMRISNCENLKQEDFEFQPKSLPFVKDLRSLAECLDMTSPHLTLCVHRKRIGTNAMLEGENLCSDANYFFNCVQKVLQNKCNNAQRAFFKSIRQPLFAYLLPHCLEDDALPFQSPQNSFDTNSYPEDAPVVSEVHELGKVDYDSSTNTAISISKISEVHGLEKVDSAASTISTISSTYATKVSGVHGLNKVNYGASTNATVSPTNATEVRVLHQHVIITMTYKEKNAANQIYVCFHLFVLVFLLGLWKEL